MFRVFSLVVAAECDDHLHLLQSHVAKRDSIASVKEPCYGIMPATGLRFECEFPYAAWYNGNKQVTSCDTKPEIPSAWNGHIKASFCASKVGALPKHEIDNYGLRNKATNQALLLCTPGCPGYVAPTAAGAVEDFACPDGKCTCRGWGDPHISTTFRGHHLDWQGYGIYKYAGTNDGGAYQGAQCRQPYYGKDYRKIAASGVFDPQQTVHYTEFFATAGKISGHVIVNMKLSWTMGKDWVSYGKYKPGKGYSLRVDDSCYVYSTGGTKDMCLINVNCQNGDRPSGITVGRGCDVHLAWDEFSPEFANGDLAFRKAFSRGEDTQKHINWAPNHPFLGDKDNKIRFYVAEQYSAQAFMVEIQDDKLQNTGICANTVTPGFPGDVEHNPHDGMTVPLTEMLFNEAELEFICEGWCGLPEDIEGGYKLCEPIHQPVPREPTPQDLCVENDVTFADAQDKCSKYADMLNRDCLFDYCASGGDERFIEEVDEENDLEESETTSTTVGVLDAPEVECGAPELALDFSRLTSNNLGGAGPSAGEKAMRFEGVRDGIDLIITTEEYDCVKASKNGVSNGMASIVVGSKSAVDITFTFVASGTTTPAPVLNVGITFLDLDQGKNKRRGYEAVTVCGRPDVVSSGAGSVLERSKDGQECDRFQSTTQGTGKDNPTDLAALTEQQKSVSASVYWESTSTFTATLENSMTHSRPIMFAGAPLECM